MSLPVPGRVAEALRRSTVQIISGQSGAGSGAVVGAERVITNAHVLRERFHTVESWEGKRYSVRVLKRDPRRDLALLHVAGLHDAPLSLADSDLLRPGTPVVAVGNPLGFIGALSSGVIHRVGAVRFGGPGGRTHEWICSDLRLAPGNSGGPLADYHGQMIGLNTMIAAGGLAFAVPSRAMQRFLQSGAQRSLGVTIRPVQLRDGRGALLILEIARGGAAEGASLLQGDVLVAASARSLHDPDDLLAALEETDNELIEIAFYRGRQDQLRTVKVQLKPTSVPHAA